MLDLLYTLYMFYMTPNLRLAFPHPYFYLYQTSGFALALGNLVYGLSVCGHGKAEDLGNRLRPSWIKVVLTEVRSHLLYAIINFIKDKRTDLLDSL